MENQAENVKPWNGSSVDDSAVDTLRDTDSLRKSTSKQSSKYRSSYDDLITGDARLNRIAQAEAVVRQDMFKECTFRPEIVSLPSSYGAMKGADTPFHDRVTKWQKEKETEIKNKAQALQKSEVVDCTFHPKINRNSDRAIREIRGNSPGETANDRLYKSANLYNEQRYKLIEDEKHKEDSLERSECTFQPQLITKKNKLYAQVNSKFDKPAYSTPQSSRQYSDGGHHTLQHSDLSKDHTFKPKINPIRASMSSVRAYVSTNVVDRLTRPLREGGEDGEDETGLRAFDSTAGGGQYVSAESGGRVMDMTSFMGSLAPPPASAAADTAVSANNSTAGESAAFTTPSHRRSTSNAKNRPSTAPHTGRASTGSKAATQRAVGGEEADCSKEERQLKFAQFMERQRQVTERKKLKVEQINRATTPNFKPKLVASAARAKADANTQQSAPTTVFDRLERHVQRRQSAEQNKEVVADENCTFRPQINSNAEKLRGRTSFEMSRGDLLKKETNRRMLKLQTEQEELSNMTFTPQISHYAKESGAKSVLQLSTDPSQFLDWYQNKNAERDSSRLAALKQREDEEVASCTFSPKTIDCPAYVRRIAKSMAVVKAARGSSASGADAYAEAAKTQWR